ncbi:hypothetical protein [Leisingera sp. JC1]|uniref:hypothetical protein n=1 Tax=Leisingera sp. JC1 TaxID=1855282 RepID=UPI001C3089BA|nr:hypothetical protein [Leisingera sp. JC1]
MEKTQLERPQALDPIRVEIFSNKDGSSRDCIMERTGGLGANFMLDTLVAVADLIFDEGCDGPLFRCSLARIADYPSLSSYLDRCLADPSLAASLNLERAKANYYSSIIHRPDGPFEINPSGIIPL